MLSPRKMAQSLGKVTYNSPTPCVRCGGTERYVSNGSCLGCFPRKYKSVRAEARRTGSKVFISKTPCKMCGSYRRSLETGKCSECKGVRHHQGCHGYCKIYPALVAKGYLLPHKVPVVQERARTCELCQRAMNRVRTYEKSLRRNPDLDAIYYRHVPRRELMTLAGEPVYVFTWREMADASIPDERYYCEKHAALHEFRRFIATKDDRAPGCAFCHHPDLVPPYRAGQLKRYGERKDGQSN